MRYKVGDKVKIKLHKETNCDNDCACIVPSMRRFNGETVEISQVYELSKGRYYLVEGNPWSWSECMFEDCMLEDCIDPRFT